MQSNFSTLCRGHIIPKELNKETATRFLESVEQFERILNDSGFVKLRKLMFSMQEETCQMAINKKQLPTDATTDQTI